MHVTLVHVQVRPEHIEQFIAATHLDHEASVRETTIDGMAEPRRGVNYRGRILE